MSQNVYYDDVKIIKKPLKKRIKSIILTLAVFLVLGIIAMSSLFISKSITVGGIGSFFVYGDGTVKTQKDKMYLIILGEYSTIEEAERVSLGATVQGASGFIWQSEDKYWVVGSLYQNLKDAEVVMQNLISSSSYNIAIKEVEMPKVEVDLKDYDRKGVEKIQNAIDFFDELYEKLFDFSIKFDKKECNNLAISSAISAERGKVKVFINECQNLMSMPNAKLNTIKSALIELDELLDTAIIRTIDNTGTNYYLKNLFTNVVRIKFDLFNKLK